MSHTETETPLKEMIRQLAVEQMSEGVVSIVLTRVADGSIEVSIVRELSDFGMPATGYIDQASKEFITQH